jgi:hypothetical protein
MKPSKARTGHGSVERTVTLGALTDRLRRNSFHFIAAVAPAEGDFGSTVAPPGIPDGKKFVERSGRPAVAAAPAAGARRLKERD